MRLWIFGILCLLSTGHCIQAVRGKAQIKETPGRAQLSVIIQVVEEDYIPPGTTLEKEVLEIIKDSLRIHLPKAKELRQNQQFTHVFVSVLENSNDERVLAVFSKTPTSKKPVLHVFQKPELLSQSVD